MSTMKSAYEKKIEQVVKDILPSPPPPSSSSASPIKEKDQSFRSPTKSPKKLINGNGNTKKRNRIEDNENTSSPNKKEKESKAIKNARLLKALQDVEMTLSLNQLDGNELEVL